MTTTIDLRADQPAVTHVTLLAAPGRDRSGASNSILLAPPGGGLVSRPRPSVAVLPRCTGRSRPVGGNGPRVGPHPCACEIQMVHGLVHTCRAPSTPTTPTTVREPQHEHHDGCSRRPTHVAVHRARLRRPWLARVPASPGRQTARVSRPPRRPVHRHHLGTGWSSARSSTSTATSRPRTGRRNAWP